MNVLAAVVLASLVSRLGYQMARLHHHRRRLQAAGRCAVRRARQHAKQPDRQIGVGDVLPRITPCFLASMDLFMLCIDRDGFVSRDASEERRYDGSRAFLGPFHR